MRLKTIATAAAAALLLSACTTPKNITYFPELTTGSTVQTQQLQPIRILPQDQLSIRVYTADEELTKLFNLTSTQNSSTTGTRGNFYTVDSQGNINFPVVGQLHIGGMTREEAAKYIEQQLRSRDLVKSPIVTVEYMNTGVAILGAVRSPGRYDFNRDELTILDAIAMAGDLQINGMRENILVLRDLGNGRQEAYRVNLLDAKELASSPAYYLQQDDVIYVEPNDKAKRESTPIGNSPYTPSFWLSLASFAMTITSFILMLTR